MAIGDPPIGPVFIGTDNFSNALVASTWGTARTARHFIRRYYTTLQRVKAGLVRVGHVPDKENPADFLTKWVSAAKFKMSIAYVANRAAWRARDGWRVA